MQLWGGRFTSAGDDEVAAFSRSVEVDAALAIDDIDGSTAHVRGLGWAGVLNPAEVETLVAGLAALRHDLENSPGIPHSRTST